MEGGKQKNNIDAIPSTLHRCTNELHPRKSDNNPTETQAAVAMKGTDAPQNTAARKVSPHLAGDGTGLISRQPFQHVKYKYSMQNNFYRLRPRSSAPINHRTMGGGRREGGHKIHQNQHIHTRGLHKLAPKIDRTVALNT